MFIAIDDDQNLNTDHIVRFRIESQVGKNDPTMPFFDLIADTVDGETCYVKRGVSYESADGLREAIVARHNAVVPVGAGPESPIGSVVPLRRGRHFGTPEIRR